MSTVPFVLQPQQFTDALSATEAFLSDLGQFALWPKTEISSLQEIHGALSAEVRPSWLTAIARELLLRAAWSEPSEGMWTLFGDVPPFENGLPLANYRGQRWSAAMFPLDMPTGANPAVGQVWATLGQDLVPGLTLDGAAEVRTAFPSVGFRLVLPPPSRVAGIPAGRSWQLAAALAARALIEIPAHSGSLAAHWIFTGCITHSVRDGSLLLSPVALGNKFELFDCLGQRQWGIAADQLIASPTETKEAAVAHPGKLWPVPDVEAAWRTVIRQGTVSDPEETDWPVGVREMHTFVSPALGPCLASILHFQPQRLIIWCSKEMEATLRLLLTSIEKSRAALGQCLPPPCVIPLTATSLVEAETCLAEQRSLVSFSASPVYFNLTNGNLLQRLAAYTLAQRNPDIWMIYREGSPRLNDGVPDLRFDLLRFRSGQPTSGKLKHAQIAGNGITLNWKGLMDTMPLKQPPANSRTIEPDPVHELLKRAGLPFS